MIFRELVLACRVVVLFIHVGENRLAHFLAKRIVLAVDINMWLEELSQDLIDVFQFDLA